MMFEMRYIGRDQKWRQINEDSVRHCLAGHYAELGPVIEARKEGLVIRTARAQFRHTEET